MTKRQPPIGLLTAGTYHGTDWWPKMSAGFLRKVLFFSPLLMLFQFPTTTDARPDLQIPRGEARIDGEADPEEWEGALQVEFVGGEAFMMMQDGRFLFLYIKGETAGVASVAICTGDSIQILHASAGLITARYVREGELWKQVEPFLRSPAKLITWSGQRDHRVRRS